MMRCLLASLFVLQALPAYAAEDMGRLFLTPEQRTVLEARRKARVPDKPAAMAVAPITRIDGYVRRQGGNSTIWLNGEAIAEGGRQASGARIEAPRTGPSEVSVPIGDETRSARARVGQTVDSSTGEVRDPLGEKAISVKRPAVKQPARP